MRPIYYYLGTFFLYFAEVVGGMYIKSIAIIFGFAAAFAISAITFFFPGVFYILGTNKYCSMFELQNAARDRIGAYAMVTMGGFVFVFCFYGALSDAVKPDPTKPPQGKEFDKQIIGYFTNLLNSVI